ncbi:MAG: DUF4625 domain-containing protein [Prevotellaceae bacterium]|jgi:hypothetical protein|nr:DUF4625 domain-containing protein [Prevotellaceae bacterium]
MKTIIKFTVISLVMAAMFISCDKKDSGDTTKPVINLIEPEEGDVLLIGSDVHFEMELSDDEMLHSYKVEIHNNFDGHSHETKADSEDTVDFSFDRSWDVSGKKNADIHHHEIIIPENATPGDYHLTVFCTDAAGNESHVVINIELSHEGEAHDHDE